MKTTFSLVSSALLALAISLPATALDKREHHEAVYEMGCDTCHDQGVGKFPSDEACYQCHDADKTAEMTKREGKYAKQNPHDSMHYGKDVPCQECHSEHSHKQALCQDCHTFKYPRFTK
ncbi:cytochrome c3 family protein [Ferrimonas aestuarii]|uniref:Cytochrome C n=1 Tax=Ferrimonas aestuarii TaxID=2569539 RepID=A0A4U1BNA2_9GAMM|nr:cytochrome c3 family protein [Ferrimonas aestuarii]TKB54962.1 cytochrome C [Ferrimonas aestuarii]